MIVGRDLEADQERLGPSARAAFGAGAVPIVLGGGHETAYGHFLGHVHAQRRVAILNWDAHPDVRPMDDSQGSSGTPFRQALEHPSGLCRGYTVAGLIRRRSRIPPRIFEPAAGNRILQHVDQFLGDRIDLCRSRERHARDVRSRCNRSGVRPWRQRPGDRRPVAAHLALRRLQSRRVLDGALDRRCRIVSIARCRWADGPIGGPHNLGVFAGSGGALVFSRVASDAAKYHIMSSGSTSTVQSTPCGGRTDASASRRTACN